jgi:hypothetical protein
VNAVLDELESLIAEIGGGTEWSELEPMICATAKAELGRELSPQEEQRLLEAWVAAVPRERAA